MEFWKLREVGVFFYLDILCLKSHKNGFGCCEAGNDHGFRFQEMEPMIEEGGGGGGSSSDSPQTDLGLLKTVRIACWTGIVHVNLIELDGMILLKINGLKCVWKMIC